MSNVSDSSRTSSNTSTSSSARRTPVKSSSSAQRTAPRQKASSPTSSRPTRDGAQIRHGNEGPASSKGPNFSSWANSDHLLKKGGHNNQAEVRALQNQLRESGAKDLKVDGVFGKETQKAVRNFQKSQHLKKIDGIVGPESRGALTKMNEAQTPPKAQAPQQPQTPPKAQTPQQPQTPPKAQTPQQPQTPPKAQTPQQPQTPPKAQTPQQPQTPPKAQTPQQPQTPPKAQTPQQPQTPPKAQTPQEPQTPPKAVPQARPGERPEIPAKGTDPQAQFNYLKGLIEANGGKFDPSKPSVVGLRGLNPAGQRHDSGQNTGPYNDSFAVIRQGKDGKPSVQWFQGSTHAGQARSSLSPGGVAQIRPGNYAAKPNGLHHGMDSWHVTQPNGNGNIPSYRDRNGDGQISEQERAYAERNGTTANAILFHNGKGQNHGSSIGCQTMSPQVYQQFIKALGPGGFNYHLIDANQPTPTR